MAKHIHRKLTPQERERSRAARKSFEADKDRMIEKGRQIFERHERLREIVQALQTERTSQSVSLTELARRTGMSTASLSRLENDPSANPTLATLSRIAQALGREVHITLKEAA